MTEMILIAKLGPKHISELCKGHGFLYGRVTAMEGVNTQFGTSTRFKGDFRLRNAAGGGDLAYSGQCFLPRAAEGLLESACRSASVESGSDRWQVDFAFELREVPDPNKKLNHLWECKPIVQTTGSDQLAQLAASIDQATKGKAK